jgi:hypothetical protein
MNIEKNIEKMSPYNVYQHALGVIKGRWQEAEHIVARDAQWACQYAVNVTQERFPAAEPIIAKSAYHALDYAKNVIQGRWEEAEEVIIQDNYLAVTYALEVIQERWYELEELILQDEKQKEIYIERFFPNQTVVTKDEIGELNWGNLEGCFADAELFKPRKSSLLDMVIE